eukprot:CAMPEP_0117049734 /NCGR_PEP_ID=MMETSP0472-20121206/34343_1 /TAXON_ID=693140 ORGANISM="Tiarina fusus, Strain LIS" /NCGR_SAMPLE_ID=MMETSP0472 /ASSEMBLY_ACC=CAM_ASM_000603 /LENGTH=1100 /DNA_ID=CAMNT_0004763257 /DNA_START=351 /DNA_END=3653 /DNA_ORIENTATION=-
MPLQTRRQAAAAASQESASQEEPPHRAAQEEETPNKRHSAQQHGSAPGSASRASPEHRYESPAMSRQAARAAESTSASRHVPESPSGRRTWNESGGRAHRHPPPPPHHGAAPDHLFSPPQFKTDRYQHHPQREHPPHAMDERTARDYDQLDLNEDIGPEMDDALFPLSSFAEESPPRTAARSPEPVDPNSERKRPASSSHPRRSPPQQPYSYSYTSSSQHGRTPSRSGGGEYQSTPSSQGRTPMYQYGYQHGSPPAPGYGPRSSPRSNYYYGPSSYYNYHPEQQHWEAPYHRYPPPGGPPPPPPPYYDRDEDTIPAPPQSAVKRPKEEPMSPTGTRQETPEQEKPARSPFRSPPQSMGKSRPYRRSPMNQQSPYIGGYGSWDMNMNTPSGTLAQEAFSPMGATFAGFDENTPLHLGEGLGPKLSISHSGSHDSDTPMGRRLRPKNAASSPITGLLNDMSPFDRGLIRGTPGSPVHHGHRYDDHVPGSRGPPSSARSKGSVMLSAGREGHSSRIPRTPLESVAKPRKLWPGEHPPPASTPGHVRMEHPPPASTPGHVRMEIGGSGSGGGRTSFEGINSMMQSHHSSRDTPHHSTREPPHHVPRETPHHASRETPSRRGESYSASAPPSHHHAGPPPPPHHYPPPALHYRSDMTTPIKPVGHHSHHQQGRPTPSTGRHHSYAPGSATKSAYTPTAPPQSEYPPSAHASSGQKPVFRERPADSEKLRQAPGSTGKENAKKKSPGKRSPCNCKRSKCLKLYCECFAAERFCDGCNCSDCGNTPNAGMLRDKAIKDTRAKNPNAFKPRIGAKPLQGRSNHSGHNMGCRCKKSECLKKYCECFQAGVICGGKCKCVDCLNYAGSQALIDKRRKIKDQRGADFAMRVADEAWKGRVPHGAKKPPPQPAPAAAASSSSRRLPSPGRRPPSGHHMTHPSPRGPPPGSHPHPYYMHPHYMHPPPPGHSPSMMGIPITPAGYAYPPHMAPGEAPPHGMYHPPPTIPHSAARKPPPPRQSKTVTPGTASTPKTPAVRVFKFDPATSRKKRKLSPDGKEPTLPYFGEQTPQQPKTTVLAIFSFLTNDDLFNAGLVCKSWSQLATDGELWKFEK